MKKIAKHTVAAVVLVASLIAGCSQEPAEIHYGDDQCAHCRMAISDSRFVAQIVTEKGKPVKFDAIECMIAYQKSGNTDLKNVKLWVGSFTEPGRWLPLEEAYIVKSDVIKSPMGESLLALPSSAAADEHLKEYPGEVTEWTAPGAM